MEDQQLCFAYIEKEQGDDLFCFYVFGTQACIVAALAEHHIVMRNERHYFFKLEPLAMSFPFVMGRVAMTRQVRNAKEVQDHNNSIGNAFKFSSAPISGEAARASPSISVPYPPIVTPWP